MAREVSRTKTELRIVREGKDIANNIHAALCRIRTRIIADIMNRAKVPPCMDLTIGDDSDGEDENLYDSDAVSDDDPVEYVVPSPEERAFELAEARKDGMEVEDNGRLNQLKKRAFRYDYTGNEGISDNEHDDSDAEDMPKRGVLSTDESKVLKNAHKFIRLWKDCAYPVSRDSKPFLTPHILSDIIDGIHATCGIVITDDDFPDKASRRGAIELDDVAMQYRGVIAGVNNLCYIHEFMKAACEVMEAWKAVNKYALAIPVSEWETVTAFKYLGAEVSKPLSNA